MSTNQDNPAAASAEAEDRPTWVQPLAGLLGQRLAALYDAPDEPLLNHLLLLLCAALGRGVTSVALSGPPPAEVEASHWPEGYRQALAASPLCRPCDGPLVLEGDALSWRRWHQQQQSVLAELVRRAGTRTADTDPPGEPANPTAGPAASPELTAPLTAPAKTPLKTPQKTPLTPPPNAPLTPPAKTPSQTSFQTPLNGQQLDAVEAVLTQRLVLLEGGPGTGKTSTVAAMVAAVQERWPSSRIQLAAPTGKAAARLRRATGGAFPCTTLHRLLESRGDHFGRHRHHPLRLDLLVVDEVSMVDQGLMDALLAALPPAARLVLVGDPAQLPPVAPGAVLLELQRSPWRQALGSACITLTTPYRNEGTLAAVASMLRQEIQADGSGTTKHTDPLTVLEPLRSTLGPGDNLSWHEHNPRQLPLPVLERLRQRQAELAQLAASLTAPPTDAAEAAHLAALSTVRDGLLVLVPRRQGRWGLEAIHRALLGERLALGPQAWPVGTPVLCTRNLPELGLANGDLGVLLGGGAQAEGGLVLFGSADAPQWLHPAQLAGAVEPAHALTVHKAQGSEAEEVIVLLPPGDPVEPRLLYTALTRARRAAWLITAPSSPAVRPAAAADRHC